MSSPKATLNGNMIPSRSGTWWTLVLFILLLAGCPRRSTSATSPVVMRASALPTASIAPPPPPLLGTEDTELPSEVAVAQNNQAFEHHKRGDYAAAAAGFREAVTTSPGFLLARYNLACALARTSDTSGAERELRYVFERDLPDVRERAHKDEDLVAFWSSEAGHELAAYEATLVDRWRAALAHGLRAMIWVDSKTQGNVVEQNIAMLRPKVLRVGVYDPSTRRFVTQSPAPRAPIGALVAQDLPFSVVATGVVNPCTNDNCPRLGAFELAMLPYDAAGAPVMRISHPPPSGNRTEDVIFATAYIDAEGATLDVLDWANTNAGIRRARVTASGVTEQRHTEGELKSPHRMDVITREGVGVTHVAPGFSFSQATTELTTPSGKKIKLGYGRRESVRAPSMVRAPDGASVVVVFVDSGCACHESNYDSKVRHVVMRVALETGEVTTVAKGAGNAEAEFDSDGQLWVQSDRTLERASDHVAAPAHVLLAPPSVLTSYCCGL